MGLELCVRAVVGLFNQWRSLCVAEFPPYHTAEKGTYKQTGHGAIQEDSLPVSFSGIGTH